MKKIIWVQLCAILLIFLTAAAMGKPGSDEKNVIALLEERIAILNYYYGGKMALEDAKTNLTRISAGTLLDEDIALMEGFSKTEVDQITEYDLQLLSCQRSNFGIIKGELQVHWVLYGQNGYWMTEESYYFTAECDRDAIKLTQLKKM